MNLRNVFATTAVAVAVAACGDTELPSIEVTPGEVSVPVGLSQDVDVMQGGMPADLDELAWQVADPAIATVTWDDHHLVVRGRSVGQTYLVTEYDGADVTVEVVVTDAIAQGLEVATPAVRVPVGVRAPLVATAQMSDGARVDVSTEAVWTIEDSAVADIEDLLVHGRQTGTTMGHVEYRGFIASFGVEVVDATLQKLALSPASPVMPQGIGVTFTASGIFSDGTVVDLTTDVTWSISDPSVATLVGHQATGMAAGTTSVIASHAGLTELAVLTVSDVVPVELHVTPELATVPAGFAETFHATVSLSDDSELDVTDQVAWTSSTPLVASVQSGSTVHTWLPGTTAVTATLAGLESRAQLDVLSAILVSLEVTPGSIAMTTGTARPISATGYFSDGTWQDMTGGVNWWTRDTNTLSVAPGTVSAIAPGRGVVSASLGDVAGTAEVEVMPSEPE